MPANTLEKPPDTEAKTLSPEVLRMHGLWSDQCAKQLVCQDASHKKTRGHHTECTLCSGTVGLQEMLDNSMTLETAKRKAGLKLPWRTMIQPSSLLTQAEANTSNKESEAKRAQGPNHESDLALSQCRVLGCDLWTQTLGKFKESKSHLECHGSCKCRTSAKHDSLSCVGHLATTAHFIQFLLLRPRHSRNINVFMLIIWWNLQFQSHAPSRSTISQNQLATSEIDWTAATCFTPGLPLSRWLLPAH